MSIPGPFCRVDSQPIATWNWEPSPKPRYRFDSAGGLWRVRYAARSEEGAARERYRDTGSMIPADHANRSRTTPETSPNLAFFAHAPLTGTSVPLRTRSDLLDRLVLRRGFTVDFAY